VTTPTGGGPEGTGCPSADVAKRMPAKENVPFLCLPVGISNTSIIMLSFSPQANSAQVERG